MVGRQDVDLAVIGVAVVVFLAVVIGKMSKK